MRQMAESTDWLIRKRVLLREENLGCGRAVSSAINWFFEEVDHGIIVEDDCLPHPSFFPFCETFLERHRHDAQVWSIAGTNLVPNAIRIPESHFFSKYSGIWGWATWRRAWESYRYQLSECPAEEWQAVIKAQSCNAIEEGYWEHILGLMLSGEIDTWDFQVQFSSWKASGLHLTSGRNLVENVGFREDATHTKSASPLTDRAITPNLPPYDKLPIERNEAVDRVVFGEKLRASRELVDWLFSQQRLTALTREISALKEHVRVLDKERESQEERAIHLETALARLKAELAERTGLRGALRALRSTNLS